MGQAIELQRYKYNPILKPDDFTKSDVGAVFNCGAVVTAEGKVVMLYRVVPSGYKKKTSGCGYDDYISSIGYAVSDDGYNFSLKEKAVITPQEKWDRYGCEDPRITRFSDNKGSTYLISYTALATPAFSGLGGDRVALATTEDFTSYTRHGVIIPGLSDKDSVFFPERINGKMVLLHRIPPNIQIAYFEDMEEIINTDKDYWSQQHKFVEKHTILKRKYAWESVKIGAGPPPVKTEEGWLLIYHGVDEKHVYRAGVALLDLNNPLKVIARSPYPILEPKADYEKYGDINNVVFPEGAVILDDTLFVYYGAADKVCALATIQVQDLLDHLRRP